MPPLLRNDVARRIALAAQGFARPRPTGRVGPSQLRRVIHRLGLLQIDYVNVLVPAQYQVLFSRLGPFRRSQLDELVFERRDFVEQWAHVASIVPMQSWPLLEYRRQEFRHSKRLGPILHKHASFVASVLERVRASGPLSADDFEMPAGVERRLPGVWRRSFPRAVLDFHFGHGRLVAAKRRANFMREFDLPERVVPEEHRSRRVSKSEAQRELLERAARAQGIATAGDLADYWRMPMSEVRPHLAELVERGAIRKVEVEGWTESAYLHPEAKRPRSIDVASLLSPFDPVVWTRARAARLFDFDYRIEIFLPASKRVWGYYVLPFLLGDRLVARVDLKAQRAAKRLDVLAAYLEGNAKVDRVAAPLARELHTLAGWLGLDAVRVERRGNLARALASAVRRSGC